MREEKIITVHKRSPSNLRGEKIKSIGKFIIFVLSVVVKDEFPNSIVRFREVLILSNNL